MVLKFKCQIIFNFYFLFSFLIFYIYFIFCIFSLWIFNICMISGIWIWIRIYLPPWIRIRIPNPDLDNRFKIRWKKCNWTWSTYFLQWKIWYFSSLRKRGTVCLDIWFFWPGSWSGFDRWPGSGFVFDRFGTTSLDTDPGQIPKNIQNISKNRH